MALHVVGDEPHRARSAFAEAFASADGKDGQSQSPGLALLVLRDAGVDRAV